MIKNTKAITPLLGMMFILMITVLTLSIIQAYQVPRWMKDSEVEHYNKLISEVSDIPGILTSGKQGVIRLDAGLDYPDYPFLLTPPTAPSSILFVDKPVNITYDAVLPNGEVKSCQISEKSYNIIVDPQYIYTDTELNLGKVVLEHGLVFRKGKNFYIPITNQILFSGNRIIFPIIKTDLKDFSTSTVISFKISPVRLGYSLAKEINITFETEFEDYWHRNLDDWKNLLSSQGFLINYTIESLGSDHLIRIHGLAPENLNFIVNFPVWYIGLERQAVESNVSMLIATPTNVSLYTGSVARIDVWAYDRYGQPVQGARVDYKAENLEVVSSSPITNSAGLSYFYVKALKPGNYTVKFSSGSASVSVGFIVSSKERTQVLLPTDDSYVSSSEPSENYGSSEYLVMGKRYEVLLKFDLSHLENANVSEAKLRMYVHNSSISNYELSVAYLILTDWNETVVTWNSKPKTGGVVGYQIIPKVEGIWLEWDVKSYVANKSNFGLLLNATRDQIVFYSKEHGSNIPQLFIRYS